MNSRTSSIGASPILTRPTKVSATNVGQHRACSRLVHGDQRLSAAERVEIYANAYFYRLLECLGEDFPATLAVLGADNFPALVKEYLLEHPPTEPSILYAGLYLADFLNDHPFAERWPFISDLARLERAVLDVFHAADAPHSVSKLCMRFLQRTGLRLSCERIRRSKSYTVNGE